ncbi:MAG TPA: PKD domain-containing protein [Chitinophagaceae bacterium]|nr:PKD domain-containing protein [Chitinophagaceae bacterium]
MKNQSRHLSLAHPEKKSMLTLVTIATLLIGVFLMASCRKSTDMPFTGDEPVSNTDSVSVMREAAALAVNTYYLSPSGNDNNSGSIDQPWFTLQKAWTVLAAGDLLYLRGGKYTYTVQPYLTGKSGTAGNLIKVWAYPGESPVITRGTSFNKSNGWHRGMVYLSGNYIHLKGIRFTGMYTDDNQVDAGLQTYNVNNCVFELLECDNNVEGMIVENNSNNNLILNSDFHDNFSNYGGSNGGNSDGLGLTYMIGQNTTTTVRGCRAWNNGDDGFDTFENSGYVLIDSCWSWHNGYNKGTNTSAGDGVGFKLGSDFLTTPAGVGVVKRRLQRSLGFDNRNAGAHINEADFSTEIFNNVFFRNKITGLNFHYNNRVHTFRNNVSFGNTDKDVEISGNSIRSNNSAGTAGNDGGWTTNASAADFLNTDTSGIRNARQANGSLPNINFLKLAAGSDLIDAGMNVGLYFTGNNPDRAALEYGGVSVPVVNLPPVVNAGVDKTITLPVNNVTLSGSATDADGSIAVYAWTRTSGPSTPTLSGANTSSLSASNLVAGTYLFRLTATDNNGATAWDETVVIVAGSGTPANLAPTANAGTDKTIVLPVNSIALTGSGTDPDGTIASYAWTYRSGPSTPVLTGATTANVTAGSLVAGTYVLRLTVKDNGGLSGFDDVNIIVSASTTTNLPPVANAGPDKTITLPTNTVTFLGSATDPDGTIASYNWTYRTGPATPSLTGARTATLKASNLKAGTYTFRLTVKDNKGKAAFDEVNVIVKAAASTGGTKPISVSNAVADAGYSYYVVQDFGILPDDGANPVRSTLRIFENGVELNPAHSTHYDIQTIGRGRFSHWGDGSFIVLYFSASDNTNPKTNGRTYTYTTVQ